MSTGRGGRTKQSTSIKNLNLTDARITEHVCFTLHVPKWLMGSLLFKHLFWKYETKILEVSSPYKYLDRPGSRFKHESQGGPQYTMQISPLRQVQSLTYEAKRMIKKKKKCSCGSFIVWSMVFTLLSQCNWNVYQNQKTEGFRSIM